MSTITLGLLLHIYQPPVQTPREGTVTPQGY